MSGDWRRLHRVRGVSSGSPENHWVPWLIHKVKTEEPKTVLQQLQTGLTGGSVSGIHPGYRKEGSRQIPSRIPLYSYWDSLCVILLGLLPCNRLGTCPLDYIKEGQVPSRASTIPPGNKTQAQGAILLQTGCRLATLATRTCINLVSCVLARTFGFQNMAIPTFYLAAGTSHGGREV
jgi:hypothetical protein